MMVYLVYSIFKLHFIETCLKIFDDIGLKELPNSSHIMHGLIEWLTGNDEMAIELRKRCVFKIIPMLNPDGVYYGW